MSYKNSVLLNVLEFVSNYVPTKLNQSKLWYVLLTYAEIPFTCLLPYIHGHYLRATVDYMLGITFSFLVNGNWTYLLLVESIVGYFYGHLPRWTPKIRGVGVDLRTGTAALICVILVRYLVNMYTESSIHPNSTTIKEFTPNTVMVMAIKIGHLCRRDKSMNVTFPDWLSYCFTLNGSLSGMSVKLNHWYDWIDEKHFVEKNKLKKVGLFLALKTVFQSLMCSIINLLFYDLASHLVETMRFLSYNELAYKIGINSRPVNIIFNIMSLLLLAFSHRCMYYVVWLCFWAQLCGSQFSFCQLKETKNTKFGYEREKNINVIKVENCITMVELVANWNILAARYWRSTIFKPAITMGVSHGTAMFLTNTASALWHGGRFNILTFFWLSTWMMLNAKIGWKLIRPKYFIMEREAKLRIMERKRRNENQKFTDYVCVLKGKLYRFICHLWTKILLAGTEQTYVLSTYKDVIHFMKQILYYPLWLPLSLSLFNAILWYSSKKFQHYSYLYNEEKKSMSCPVKSKI